KIVAACRADAPAVPDARGRALDLRRVLEGERRDPPGRWRRRSSLRSAARDARAVDGGGEHPRLRARRDEQRLPYRDLPAQRERRHDRVGGAVWLVHRTAESQVLGPNSALHVYRSTDGGKTFAERAVIPAPSDRDLRDPSFFVVGDALYIKVIARLPVL